MFAVWHKTWLSTLQHRWHIPEELIKPGPQVLNRVHHSYYHFLGTQAVPHCLTYSWVNLVVPKNWAAYFIAERSVRQRCSWVNWGEIAVVFLGLLHLRRAPPRSFECSYMRLIESNLFSPLGTHLLWAWARNLCFKSNFEKRLLFGCLQWPLCWHHGWFPSTGNNGRCYLVVFIPALS